MSKILGIDVDEAVARGLNAWADHTLGYIINRTPYKTGALRMSLAAEAATRDNLFVTFISRSSILKESKESKTGKVWKPYNHYVHDGSDNKNWTTQGTGNLFLVIPAIQEYSKLQSKFIPEALKGLMK